MKYHDNITQGTPEWSELRRGIITASVASKLITPTGKVANNETVRQLAYQLAAERITGRVAPSFVSFDMERGHIEEVFARELYQKSYGYLYGNVSECGFIETDRYGFRMGYSPDGLVGTDGLIEIKSRQAKFQIETFLAGGVPSEYMLQLRFGLIVSGREWIDFVQYSNGMHLYRSRVTLDGVDTGAIIEAASLFEKRVVEIVHEYTEATEGKPLADYIQHVDGSEIEVSE